MDIITYAALKRKLTTTGAEQSKIIIDTNNTETGYLKTYTFYQGGTTAANIIGKVNIPKDFLVKSGEIVDFKVGDTFPAGVTEPGKYLALTINVAMEAINDEETNQVVYINVKDLVDTYTVKSLDKVLADKDEILLALSNDLELSATIVNGTISRQKIDAEFEAQLAELEAAMGKVQIGTNPDGTPIMGYISVSEQIKSEAKDGTYKPEIKEVGNPGDPDYVAPEAEITIAEAIANLENDMAELTPIQNVGNLF